MTNGLLPASRSVLPCLFALCFVRAAAQGTDGNCSITLLSDESLLNQHWCLETPVVTIEPIKWLVEGTGVQLIYPPNGISAVLSNDTLTVSGTLTGQGLNNPHIATSEGCASSAMLMDLSVIVDPGLSCSVQGQDVIVQWPGMNSLLQWGQEFFLDCSSADGFTDFQFLPLPGPDSFTWYGLPTNTELTFTLWGEGIPYCFPGFYTTTCTIIATGVGEFAQDPLAVRAVPVGDLLQLSAPEVLSEVRVHDMLGSLVAAQRVNARTADIPIASLAAGPYVLRVVDATGRPSVQRFVKGR